MMEILRKTFALLKKHPSLALPVLIADILHFAIILLEGLVRQTLLQAWATRHEAVQSVLLGNSGGGGYLPSRGAMETYVAVSRVLPLFLGALLYAGALYATLRMVQNFTRDEEAVGKTVFSPWPGVALLRLACWVFGVGVVINVAVLLIVARVQNSGSPWAGRLSDVEAAMQLLASAWLVAPFAVRFVAAQCERVASKKVVFAGQLFAVVTVAISTGMMYATNPLIRRAFDHIVYAPVITFAGVRAAQSLLSALPYVVLFVALALLDDGEQRPE